MSVRKIFIALLFVLASLACSKDVVSVITSFTGFEKPIHFPDTEYQIQSKNPITKEGFELGRKLFYDARLSRNNTISCGTCHIQSAAFTHHGHDVSHGIEDRLGLRNSQPIMNLAWNKTFFWDGGVFDLDLQPIVPITNHVEMDETVDRVLDKLKADQQYPDLFRKAFGSSEITATRFLKALSQFMLMCVSSNSKYDSVRLYPDKVSFSEKEKKGYTLFITHCSNCHKEPLFTDLSFRNNGLTPANNNDEGRYSISLNPADKYKFIVPSLRNLSFTSPYMHDGRFYDLPTVLEHYTSKLSDKYGVDSLLIKNGKPKIELNTIDKENILAFLKTLDDKVFITNPQLAEQ